MIDRKYLRCAEMFDMNDDPKNFGESYWNLHRNSLASSSLLFLSSLRIIKIDKIQFWNVEESYNFIPICIFLVSTYMFLVYISNGREQASKRHKQDISLIVGQQRTLIEQVAEISESAKSIENIAGRTQSLVDGFLVSNFGNVKNSNAKDLIDQIISEKLHKEIYELQEEILDFGYKSVESRPDNNDIAAQQMHSHWRRGFSNRIAPKLEILYSAMYGVAYDYIKTQTEPHLNNLKEFIKEELDKSRTINLTIENLNKQISQYNIKILMRRTSARFDFLISGWAIPVVAYSIAVLHFFGMYYSIFPNALGVLDWIGVLKIPGK